MCRPLVTAAYLELEPYTVSLRMAEGWRSRMVPAVTNCLIAGISHYHSAACTYSRI